MNKEEEHPKREILQKEEHQTAWLLLLIVIAFASILGPYFFIQAQKKFTAYNISWNIETYGKLTVYHGRFPAFFSEKNGTHNLYFRVDPRENNVSASGNFKDMYFGGIVSFDKDTALCGGEVSRSMIDLSGFLKYGMGFKQVEVASSDSEFYKEVKQPYVTCSNVENRTVIMIQKGNISSVTQSFENPYCYTVTVKNCEDVAPVEKFMLKMHDDFYTFLQSQQ